MPAIFRSILFVTLILACGRLWAAWEITRFVAYEGYAVDAPDRREAWEASLDPSAGVTMADQALGVVSPGWREQEEGQENKVLDQSMLTSIEFFLEKVAIEYSNLGFADPVAAGWLDSIVLDANGDKAIRFYIREKPGAPQGWFSSGETCDANRVSRKVLNINTLKFAPPDEQGIRVIRGVDWATLAHELMHPVLYASRFMQGRCTVGGWISEGIPDAISFDVTRKVLGIDFRDALEPETDSRILKIYGIRNYAQPLQGHILAANPATNTAGFKLDETLLENANINTNYPTSSFWRYLAETWYVKRRNPNAPFPGSRANAGVGISYVDYGYLVEMFDKEHPYSPDPMKANPAGDIRWINEFLKSERYIKTSLSRTYGRFISSFANYDVDRIGPARKAAEPPGVNWNPPTRELWMKALFNGCDIAKNVIGSEQGADVDVRVLPNAATCIQADPAPGPYPHGTAVDILVLGNELGLLKQLRIGLPDGTMVLAPEIYSFMGNGAPYYARWSFPFSAARSGTYILINMAAVPEKTRHFIGNLRFSLGTWESDMTTVPLPPSEPPAAENSDGWRPTRRERVKQDLDAAIAAPLEHLVPMPNVKRKDYDKTPNCDPQRLRLNLCGPQLHISLDLNPLGAVTGIHGAGAANLHSDLIGGAGINPMAAIQDNIGVYLEAERELEARDGDSIDIYVPKIEYGFTGSFDNAVIEVDKARTGKRDNEKDYSAYGKPVSRDDGQGKIWRPPSGEVTIDEYSQYVLSGSFRADLIDEEAGSADNPVIARTVSGRFRIPAPFTGDENFELVSEQFEDEMIQSMLEMMPTGHEPMQEIIRQAGAPPAIMCEKLDQYQLRAIGMEEACEGIVGAAGISAKVVSVCSCECDARQREKPLPECQSQCDAEWRQCPSGEAQLSGGLAEEITHYRSLMQARGLPLEMQDVMIEQYKKMPEWQRKLTIQGYQ